MSFELRDWSFELGLANYEWQTVRLAVVVIRLVKDENE